ncbi:hypothetical protein H0S58_06495 [Acinetobacter sp. TTH0-4]|uniref:hypothetical protein n=1 Tax=Acinetobacter sp. TTH0-4 TaxID=1646498 RepID=UPI00189F5F19|nr:hypothetical protein [Acinetobacter sp. TTH0-4]QPF36775.1 hypothetical protein H0S58_06495 [Acinetobacter sp. TTH0-4]
MNAPHVYAFSFIKTSINNILKTVLDKEFKKMALVCNQLESNTNQCLEWVEQPTLLPKLTLAEGNAIGFACLLVFATVFVIKMCIRTIK